MHAGSRLYVPQRSRARLGILIVVYPFITGLVAGAFILASLERVFRVEAVKPTYRLALLMRSRFCWWPRSRCSSTWPSRAFFRDVSDAAPHFRDAMFGFVYLWYLMLSSCWKSGWITDGHRLLSQSTKGLKRVIYRVLTLGSTNISENALRIDDRAATSSRGRHSSAFLLHGYVGFIFGRSRRIPGGPRR